MIGENENEQPEMNIFELPEFPLPEELTTILAESGGVRIERVVSAGQSSGWYKQNETEFVILLEGSAVVEYENGNEAILSRGDTLLIRPHERHRVSHTSIEPPCIWLCVFY